MRALFEERRNALEELKVWQGTRKFEEWLLELAEGVLGGEGAVEMPRVSCWLQMRVELVDHVCAQETHNYLATLENIALAGAKDESRTARCLDRANRLHKSTGFVRDDWTEWY